MRPLRLPSKSVAAGTRRTGRVRAVAQRHADRGAPARLDRYSWPQLGQRVCLGPRGLRRGGPLVLTALCGLGQIAAKLSTSSCTRRNTGLLGSDCPCGAVPAERRAASTPLPSLHPGSTPPATDRGRLLADDVGHALTPRLHRAPGAGEGQQGKRRKSLGTRKRDQPPKEDLPRRESRERPTQFFARQPGGCRR